MSIQHISFQSKEAVHKALAVLKEKKKITEEEIKNLDQLKEKRTSLSEKMEQLEKQYRINNVSENQYDSIKKQYNSNMYKLDLEILKRTQDITHKTLYLKRLEYIDLMLKFPIDKKIITFNNTNLSIEQIYEKILKNVVEENVEQLKFKQQIIRLNVLYNVDKEVFLEDNLYDLHNRIESQKNKVLNYEKIDFSQLTLEEFLEEDITKIYDKLFLQGKQKNK